MNPQTPQLPHDIANLYPYEWPVWQMIVGVLVAILLIWFVSKLLKKFFKRDESAIEMPTPAVPAMLRAWRGLNGLKVERPFDRKQQQEFYYNLSMSLRSVVEAAKGIPATDRTLRELKPLLRRSHVWDDQVTDEVLGFLNKADMVKFADLEAQEAVAERDFQKVQEWARPLYQRWQEQAGGES